jgi:hypothetical protein
VTHAAIVAECAAVIDVPKAEPPTSFELHAPLELLARGILLERAPEDVVELAERRLAWMAEKYAAAGPSATSWPDNAPSVDAVTTSLAAAGHAPILLTLRPRVDAVAPTFGDAMVASEVARQPDWQLRWPRTRTVTGTPTADLTERLAAPPSPGDPGSSFIFPTMSLTESSGLSSAALTDALRGLDVPTATTTLLRVAAHSMLQDDPGAAPYGWTHCLTMPQAVLGAVAHGADPDVAVGVAATYVLGFRSTLGRVALDPDFFPEESSAAGRAWRAGDDERAAITVDLVAHALVHPDAHLAKYTLACLDAAASDPEAAHLFLAASAQLHAWWQANPPEGSDAILSDFALAHRPAAPSSGAV